MKCLSLCPFPWLIKVYYSKKQASRYQGNKTPRGVCRTFSKCWHIIYISDPVKRGENFATKRRKVFPCFYYPVVLGWAWNAHTHTHKTLKMSKNVLLFKLQMFVVFCISLGLQMKTPGLKFQVQQSQQVRTDLRFYCGSFLPRKVKDIQSLNRSVFQLDFHGNPHAQRCCLCEHVNTGYIHRYVY